MFQLGPCESATTKLGRCLQAQHPGRTDPSNPACADDSCVASAYMLGQVLFFSTQPPHTRPSLLLTACAVLRDIKLHICMGQKSACRPLCGMMQGNLCVCRSQEHLDHQRTALRQQCAPFGQHHRVCAQCGCVRPLLPQPGVQQHLHLWH